MPCTWDYVSERAVTPRIKPHTASLREVGLQAAYLQHTMHGSQVEWRQVDARGLGKGLRAIEAVEQVDCADLCLQNDADMQVDVLPPTSLRQVCSTHTLVTVSQR